jgi:hypothetical protein
MVYPFADVRRAAAALAIGMTSAVAILEGCAAPPRPPPPPVSPRPSEATRPPPAPQPPPPTEPAHSRAGAFFFLREGQDAKLAYGPAQSDSLLLLLQCRQGAQWVRIIDGAHVPAMGQTLTLISGTARSDLPVRIEADAEHNGWLALAEAPMTLPALAGFRSSGKIMLRMDGHTTSLLARPKEMKRVARFFSVCEGRLP